ncbi:hypothetical protein [Ornithinimicrobium kibberense]|uniref:hypothetical protein n=1 Tax=Ornithinimicrobium kibberense TaxID=282060 RepID=UPI00360B2CE3
MQGTQQHPHVPAGDHDRLGVGDEPPDVEPGGDDGVAVVRLPPGVELVVEIAHPLQVPHVHLAHDRQDVLDGQLHDPGVTGGVLPDPPQGLDGLLEPDEVELLHLGVHQPAAPVGLGQLGVGLPDLLHELPQPEVDAPVAELLGEERVVGLAVAPPGGDRGEPAPRQAEVGHDLPDPGGALRSEQGDPGVGGQVLRDRVSRHGPARRDPPRRA